jgi:hypothetical protein
MKKMIKNFTLAVIVGLSMPMVATPFGKTCEGLGGSFSQAASGLLTATQDLGIAIDNAAMNIPSTMVAALPVICSYSLLAREDLFATKDKDGSVIRMVLTKAKGVLPNEWVAERPATGFRCLHNGMYKFSQHVGSSIGTGAVKTVKTVGEAMVKLIKNIPTYFTDYTIASVLVAGTVLTAGYIYDTKKRSHLREEAKTGFVKRMGVSAVGGLIVAAVIATANAMS